MITTSEFADAVGRKKIADRLDVKATAVSNAVVAGLFPSSWFDVLELLAAEAGVECPRALFSFRPVANTPNVDAVNLLQGAAE